MRIDNLYALIKIHRNGEEEILSTDTRYGRLYRELQEKQWSSIQNTGKNRTDLYIATFTRERD